mmetsp:Transcript_4868/g.7415  ORF Transcript_4868/g.7415 Transcript_4868/m.7415 type:complete len:483 (+) Transcript_4868:119-1567(+)
MTDQKYNKIKKMNETTISPFYKQDIPADETGGSEIRPLEQSNDKKSTDCMTMKHIFEGGTIFDGFLLAASKEVGQVILTLPYSFSLVGIYSGIFMEVFFATLALYTNFLLISLHAEYRHKINTDTSHPYYNDKHHIVTYTEVITYFVGSTAGKVTRVIIYLSLIGLSTVQIIATSSNFHILDDSLSKRDWGLLWGMLFTLMIFIPNFRHYRFMSVIGIVSTTYTSWFMTTQSNLHGRDSNVTYSAPDTLINYFMGFTNIMFTFGGHSSNIEVADVMNDPSTYDRSYLLSYIYVFTLTLPNAISVYYNFGDDARDDANSFNLFQRSPQRDIGIVLMCLHQMVAFGLFSGPLYHMWEEYLGIHGSSYHIRVLSRLPIAGAILFMAIAFPFYGSVNSLLGAFAMSMATYIIPLLSYNIAFANVDHHKDMVKAPPQWAHIPYMRAVNWFLAGVLIFAGVGVGGYAAMVKFLRDLDEFEYFAKCYQC